MSGDYFLNRIYDSILNKAELPNKTKPEPKEDKKQFKPLTQVYEVLLREVEHVAIYGSKDDVDPNNIPPKPDLEVLGVASKDLVNKLKRQINFEKGDIKTLLNSVFEKANIPQNHREAFPLVYNRLMESGFGYVEQLLNLIIKHNGIFKADASDQYNAVTTAINTLKVLMPDVENFDNEVGALKELFSKLIEDSPKIASTNIGPGELFFSIFSNAKIAGGEGGKSGDLQLGDNIVEVKGTVTKGARLGGDGAALYAMIEIPKKLGNLFVRSSGKEETKIKAINKIKVAVEQAKLSQEPEQAYQNLKTIVQQVAQDRFADTNYTIKFRDPKITSTITPVTSKFEASQRGVKFIERFEAFINSELGKTEGKKTLQAAKETTERRLDLLLYSAFNSLKQTPTTMDNIIDIISYTNSYKDIPIKDSLKQILPATSEEFFDKYSGNLESINKLVGAMHLYSYTQHTKFNRLMLINTKTDNVIFFNAPTTLQEALNIVSAPGVRVDASVDSPTVKTQYGKSVYLEYKA